jgi:hypothetical protein
VLAKVGKTAHLEWQIKWLVGEHRPIRMQNGSLGRNFNSRFRYFGSEFKLNWT